MKEELQFVSFDAFNLVEQMLTKDPNQRPSAKEILEHPWFTEVQEVYMPTWKKRSSILHHASLNLVKRTISKQEGNLNIGQQMPVQALIQDLL